MPITSKICPCCKQDKPIEKFGRNLGTKSGKAVYCLVCQNRKAKEKYAKDPARREYMRQYNLKPERQASKTAYRLRPAVQARIKSNQHSNHLRQKYGLTEEQYESMRTAQNDRCMICGRTAEEANCRYPSLDVDHCHRTGRVRGLLCYCCNSALGYLQDNAEFAMRAHRYLKGEL